MTPKSNESDASNSRRHSIGKATSSGSGENILPHYLRASTGSCHDFCKYGRKHAFEEKARRPFLRRNAKKPPDEQSSVEFQPERNNTSKDKHKIGNYTPPNTPESIKTEMSRKLLNRQTPATSEVMGEKKASSGVLLTKSADRQSPVLREVLARKKTVAKEVLTKSVDSQSSVSSENWAEKSKKSTQQRKKTTAVELRTSSESKTRLSPKIMKLEMSSSSEKLEVSSKHASSKVKEENMSAKHASFPEMKLSSSDSSRVLDVRENSDTKIGRRTVTSEIAVKREQIPPRALLSPKISSGGNARGLASPRASLSLKPTLRLQMSPRVLLSPKTSSGGIVKGQASSRASLSRKPSPSKVSNLKARKHWGSEIAPPLKNQNKIGKANNEHPKIKNADSDQSTEGLSNDVVEEKTLYVIKMETECKCLESDHKENHSGELSPPPFLSAKSPVLSESPLFSSHNEEDEQESEYAVTEAEDDPLSECDETEYMEESDTLEGGCKGLQQKVGIIPSEDKDDQAVKLQFRRGKVVDVQTNHNGPRRLKFRRGRMLEENRNLKAEAQRSFKRRGTEGHANIEKPDSEKVVLRHQDVHGKKDAQGLFNNVIEETASKLVETRKSKVKALVGAFETVISLQDSKPSSNTVS
ncbi:uncharacterized protein LOC110663533 [Hevea brasiliensis]|uniref:uncharacterized protein LOC110663533 n=1 Tax=Hevea brasiliensis TaxID=3981 RepID=UPI0025CDE2FD|nr:uncharacterized protein LOC110663533 [Hevea brasiliensis]